MSMTSLSICTSSETVSSRSALLSVKASPPRNHGDPQDLKQIRGMLISLGEQTQRENCNCIMTPRSIKRREQHLPILDVSESKPGNDMSSELTFDSRFFSLRLKSASSGDVIKIIFSLITIILANSRSSSFSKISAMVRKIRSALRCKHNCRMIRLPLVSSSRRSVENSSRTFFMKLVK